MSKNPYTKIGNTYYPIKSVENPCGNEIRGGGWRAWAEKGKYYYEYDSGHFATKLRTVTISEQDFNFLKEGKITEFDINRKYC